MGRKAKGTGFKMKGSPAKFMGSIAANIGKLFTAKAAQGSFWEGTNSPGWPGAQTGEAATNYSPEEIQQRQEDARNRLALLFQQRDNEATQRMQQMEEYKRKMRENVMGETFPPRGQILENPYQRMAKGGHGDGSHSHGKGSGGNVNLSPRRNWMDDAGISRADQMVGNYRRPEDSRPPGRTAGLGGMMNATQRGGGTGHSHNIGQSFFTKKIKK